MNNLQYNKTIPYYKRQPFRNCCVHTLATETKKIQTVVVSGLSEAENKNAFSLFHNPATNHISILTTLHTGFTFSIIDIAGKEVQTGIANTNLTSLSIKSMSNGIYLFQIKSTNGFFTQKFIKQ